MDLSLLLEMAADSHGDRVLVGSLDGGLTATELLGAAQRASVSLSGHAVLVDLNGPAVPVLLFAAAYAGVPFVPLNYRLDDERLRAVARRVSPATTVVGEGIGARLGLEQRGDDDGEGRMIATTALLAELTGAPRQPDLTAAADPDDVAVLLFTSGTTGEPKAAVLRHRHLVSYVISTVELSSAGTDEAALVSVPPYHIAGISAALTSVYAGRRLVYLDAFEPEAWVSAVEREGITHAMVVPTMLRRILPVLEARGGGLKSLRHLSYGGGAMPAAVIERALELLPTVAFVNAYGLTETASTIAVLGPDEHRAATSSDDPARRARLASVGLPLPTVEVEVRDADGVAVGPEIVGEIWVRGEQVAGEYREQGSLLDADGWFPTRDGGRVDAAGYLYLDGRLDDVIVRGGENISPGEIEAVLLAHPAVAEVAVVGVPNEEWGEAIVAAVVPAPGVDVDVDALPAELQEWVRARLRSTRTPERIAVLDELPHNEMGKLLRRELRATLSG